MKRNIRFLSSNNRPQYEMPTLRKLGVWAAKVLKKQDFWWGLFFLFSLFLLFVLRAEYTIPEYRIGDIARTTVRATKDIQIEDAGLTQRKKQDAQEKVLPVYDYESTLVNSSVARLQEVFSFLRNTVDTEQSGKIDVEELADQIRSNLHVYVTAPFLRAAAQKNFSEELEQYLVKELREVMSGYIVSDRNSLYLYAPKGLAVRNLESGRVETIEEAATIQDVHTVHESIKQQMEQDPAIGIQEATAYAEFLNTFVVPTIYFNNAETQSRLAAASRNVEAVFYQIKKGKVIVRDGEEVTPTVQAQLRALKETEQPSPRFKYSFGIFLLLTIYLAGLKEYFDLHQYSDIKLRGKALFRLFGLVLVFHMILVKVGLLIASSLSTTFTSPPFNNVFAYQLAIPFAAGALLLAILTDKETSIIYSFGLAILVGVLSRGDFYLVFFCLASGIAATFSIKRYYQRSSLLLGGLWIWLVNLVAFFTIFLIRESPWNLNDILFFIACTLISSILSVAVASVLAPFLEWMFNITTDIKLLELSNLDLPILRQLALEAPGTYHHSIVMGTIAEAAAEKVGANPLFLRVAALYHDIGKVRKSEYYVENQREYNKHDELNPRMSALVIINHVKEGLEVAKSLRLPSDIVEMIPQHHGTRLITYFYKKAKDMENPEMEEVKEEDYRYPGPKPQTKEGAILMLADATEAASRTLTEPSPARLRNMVDTLFRAIFEDGQLNESNLTMKDLNLIADAFVRKLESVFHHRIAYPGYEFNVDEKAKDTGESQNLPEKVAH